MDKNHWKGKAYSFFCNRDCEWFPCHPVEDEESFNCLFCYCPLYPLGESCGGNFVYLENGIKDCSSCTLPHMKDNYGVITERLQNVVEKVKHEKKP